MQVSIYRDPCFGGIQILIWEQRNGKYYVVEPMEMKLKESTAYTYEPSIKIDGSVSPFTVPSQHNTLFLSFHLICFFIAYFF
jgi:hypothetical protein